jgi:UDP-glucuronate decarboxylase
MHTSVVVGGSGFLGSHLCTELIGEGHQVICIDNFSSGRISNIDHLKKINEFKFIESDIRSPISIEETPDEIYHLASRASPVDFEEFPIEIAMSNSVGTKNVLELAAKTDSKVLLASTSEVYGDPEIHPQRESYNGNVNIRGLRASYDESKRLSEALAVAYHRNHDVDVRTVRIFNTYGPRMRPDDGRVIPNFVTQALNDQPITVHGDGSQTRSFTYVDDLIRAFRMYMLEDGLNGEVINVGSQKEITILELAETVIDTIETDSEITYVGRPEDDPERRQPDITRAQELLGWNPEISLSEGLAETAEYFETIT